MRFAGRQHEIVGSVLLKHQVHPLDVLFGEAPVAFGIQIAEPQLFLGSFSDARGSQRNLAGDEFGATQRRLVVEQNPRARVHPVRLAVVDRQPVTVELGDAVGTTRIKGRVFALRHGLHLAEHLARRSLVKTNLRIHAANRL